MRFLFGDYALDRERRELRRGAELIEVEPQVFDLLAYLVANRDRVASKDDLLAAVWHGRIVSESTLTSRITAARHAIGDSGEQQRFIRTVSRRGFRFVGEVREQSAPSPAVTPDRAPAQEVSFCRTPDGVNLAVAIVYAVRHPERVSRLVLSGGYAQGWRARANPAEIEGRKALLKLVRVGWGQDNPAFRQVFTSLMIPGATLEQAQWVNDLQRVSTSPENAARLLQAFGDIDVTQLLPRVAAPTLVLHSRGDAPCPFE